MIIIVNYCKITNINQMKTCFSQFVDRWVKEDPYILSNTQRECLGCSCFQRCWAASVGKTIGRILIQLELAHIVSAEDENGNNGDFVIVDEEDD